MACWKKRQQCSLHAGGRIICDYSYFYGLRWLLAAVGSLWSAAGQTCLWEGAQGASAPSSHPIFVLFPMCWLPHPSRDHQNSCLDGPLARPSKAVLIFLPLELSHLKTVLCLLQNFQIGKHGEGIQGNCRALRGWVTLGWGLWVSGRTRDGCELIFWAKLAQKAKKPPHGLRGSPEGCAGKCTVTAHRLICGFQSEKLLLRAYPPCLSFTLVWVFLLSAEDGGEGWGTAGECRSCYRLSAIESYSSKANSFLHLDRCPSFRRATG